MYCSTASVRADMVHTLRAVEDFGRGAFAAARRAFHRAVGNGRRLGAGPVDAAERLAQQWSVAVEDAGPEMRHRTAARPHLVEPRGLDVLDRRCRARAESFCERVEH